MTASSMAWRFLQPIQRPCRVVFAGPHFQAALPFTRDVLAQRKVPDNAHIELLHAPSDEDLLEMASEADIALPFMQIFGDDFLERATNLRLVIQYGVGLEGVDISRATQLGIAVSNIPSLATGNAQATAEHALFLSMSLLRYTMHELPRRFMSRELGGLPIPRTLKGKKVTVVGYGAVGSTLCRYLCVMGAHVTAVRHRTWSDDDTTTSLDIQRCTNLRDALPTTQLLILACKMTPETYHLLNHDTISLLPRGALVTNVGRGPLVQHEAILKALESGAVGGFASDVGVGHPTKPSEPWDPHDVLSQHPNTLFTPHVGGYCDTSYSRMANCVVDAIECIIRGNPPPVWVNRDKL
jgi:phosphoglycerate dehydrogenase-like enzyme